MGRTGEKSAKQTAKPPANSVERKRKFREKKYKSAYGNKAEGQGFAEASKLKMIRDYRRWQAKERRKGAQVTQGQSEVVVKTEVGEEGEAVIEQDDKQARKAAKFQKAAREAEEKKKLKETQREDAVEVESQREEALQKYHVKKRKKYRLLSKKTFRGQPSMGSRMEILLEQIEGKK